MWQGWFDLLAGIWLFFGAFTPGMRTPTSIIAVGVIVAVFGFWGAKERNSWQGIINSIIGIWLLLSSIWFPSCRTTEFFISRYNYNSFGDMEYYSTSGHERSLSAKAINFSGMKNPQCLA